MIVAFATLAARAQDPTPTPPPPTGGADAPATPPTVPTNEEISKAIERALEIVLASQENYVPKSAEKDPDDGKKPNAEWPYEGVYRVDREIPLGYRIGGTSICAWAVLEPEGWGKNPARQKAVERALDFVLARLDDPLMTPTFVEGYDVRGWGHTYALQFLVRMRELKRVPAKRKTHVDKAIKSLVAAIEQSEIQGVEGKVGGGWNYSRRGKPAQPSTFMTAPTLQALFAAAAQGEKVDPAVIARGLDTLERARLASGAYQYGTNPARQSGKGFEAVEGAIGRMAVCESTLMLAGRGDLGRLRASLDAFFQHWEWLEKRRKGTGTHIEPYMIAPYYFFYAHYYTAQAIELLPEADRQSYRDKLNALFFKVREPSGGWNDRVFPRSENFGTAMTLMAFLQSRLPRPAGWQVTEKL
ncbi:MAG: hypothetical protein ACKVX7_18280 [Planctomycetota bacterium]